MMSFKIKCNSITDDGFEYTLMSGESLTRVPYWNPYFYYPCPWSFDIHLYYTGMLGFSAEWN